MKVDIEYLSTRQAAVRLGVSLGTVQNMVESGVLNAWKTSGGHRRIALAAVEAMLARRAAPLPAGFSGTQDDLRLDILLSEHDATQQALFEAAIAQWKLPVKMRLASNAFDGLLEIGRQPPDILITNLPLPGMDAFAMLHHLRANALLAHIDIVVLTLPEADARLANTLPSGITCLSKPLSFDELKGFVLGRLAARQRAA